MMEGITMENMNEQIEIMIDPKITDDTEKVAAAVNLVIKEYKEAFKELGK
jgi:hypothetical protein